MYGGIYVIPEMGTNNGRKVPTNSIKILSRTFLVGLFEKYVDGERERERVREEEERECQKRTSIHNVGKLIDIHNDSTKLHYS